MTCVLRHRDIPESTFTDTVKLHKQIQVCDHSSLNIEYYDYKRKREILYLSNRTMPHAHEAHWNAAACFSVSGDHGKYFAKMTAHLKSTCTQPFANNLEK
ncbi:unnamed protein product [Boreogadus saida]